MGFFRDPKFRDFGTFIPKNPKSENPGIPRFFGIWIDFSEISRIRDFSKRYEKASANGLYPRSDTMARIGVFEQQIPLGVKKNRTLKNARTQRNSGWSL